MYNRIAAIGRMTTMFAIATLNSLIFVLSLSSFFAFGQLFCRFPDIYPKSFDNTDISSVANKNMYMIVGKVQGHGFGNSLVPFPAAFYFAAFTGRSILIYDHSALGYSCQYLQCGFKHTSELTTKYPNFTQLIQDALDLTHVDFSNHIRGERNITSQFVADYSLTPKSDWWAYNPEARECVNKLTGCPMGDVMCSERFALQSLIRGPFNKKNFSADERKLVENLPDNIKESLPLVARDSLPRYDVGIHLRSQLHSFETLTSNHSAQDLQMETDRLLNSTLIHSVFNVLKERVMQLVGQQKGATNFNVFIASDNEILKSILSKELNQTIMIDNIAVKVSVSSLQTNGIVHVKNMYKTRDFTSYTGLIELLLDWYLLSLSKTILAWRKGNSISSFAYSAQRISGNMSSSDFNLKNGFGTTGFIINNDRRGRIKLDPFWYYPTIRDI